HYLVVDSTVRPEDLCRSGRETAQRPMARKQSRACGLVDQYALAQLRQSRRIDVRQNTRRIQAWMATLRQQQACAAGAQQISHLFAAVTRIDRNRDSAQTRQREQ